MGIVVTSPGSLHSVDSSEWYTPPEIIETARKCMGGIDLDPASSPIAQTAVRARSWFGAEGLQRPWFGRVFLNPPSPPREWWCKLSLSYEASQIMEATYLVYSIEQLQQCQTWGPPNMFRHPICFPRRRLRYRKEMNGTLWDGDQPSHASAIVGVGIDAARFLFHFRPFGECVLPAT
jgi:hypothetical protein